VSDETPNNKHVPDGANTGTGGLANVMFPKGEFQLVHSSPNNVDT